MTSTASELPDTSEIVEGLMFYPIALVVSATIFPGLTLAVPGLLFVVVLVLVPLVAVALVVGLAAAIIAAPVLAVIGARRLYQRRALHLATLRGLVRRSARYASTAATAAIPARDHRSEL
jgi:hypothetical protein